MPRALPASLLLVLLPGPFLLPGPARAQDGDPPSPPDADPEAPVPAADGDDDLDAITLEMSALVEKFRGIPFTAPVARRWKDRESVREEFRPESPAKEEREGHREMNAGTRTLAFFGLVKEEGDAVEEAARFQADAVGGYYSPREKVFTLVRGDGGSLNRMIVFHELVHALEDQHFDFRATERGYRKNDLADHFAAYRALVEGSAQRSTDRYLDSEEGLRKRVFRQIIVRDTGRDPFARKEKGEEGPGGENPAPRPRPKGKPPTDFSKTPPYLILRNQMFPYHNGALFLEAVLAAPGEGSEVERLAALYRDPPVSSEQILHPEKYLGARDLPRELVLPDVLPLLGEGWEATDTDTMGELGIGIALNRFLYGPNTMIQLSAVLRPPEGGFTKPEDLMNTPLIFRGTSGKASTGWDGDRYRIFAKGKATAAVWVSVWDTPEDALEFAAAYGKILGKKYRGVAPGEDEVWRGTRDGDTALEVSGDRVFLAERIPPDRLSPVLKALHGAEVRRDPRDAIPAR